MIGVTERWMRQDGLQILGGGDDPVDPHLTKRTHGAIDGLLSRAVPDNKFGNQ